MDGVHTHFSNKQNHLRDCKLDCIVGVIKSPGLPTFVQFKLNAAGRFKTQIMDICLGFKVFFEIINHTAILNHLNLKNPVYNVVIQFS